MLSRFSAVRRGARWLRGDSRRAVILLYHRICEPEMDPQQLCVAPRRFAEHLGVLRSEFRTVSLRTLSASLREGTVPPRSVVVTFDDGYLDNLQQAKPILCRYDVPATVFVTSGYVDANREFWWDELERLLLHGERLPAVLELRINGEIVRWDLGPAAQPVEGWLAQNRGWFVASADESTGPRQRLYTSLCRLLRPLAVDARENVLEALRQWAGVNANARPPYRALSAAEVVELAEGAAVEVGAHTVMHPVLASLPVAEQHAQIVGSKTRLEEILGTGITSFSYPFGGRADYSAATVEVVREAGFECACSNYADLVRRRTSLFELPRLLVRDCDGDSFARELRNAFDD